jgi:NAD(P)-dependent dehydrogenase (short-subunit alcohol dehydrogenase family)
MRLSRILFSNNRRISVVKSLPPRFTGQVAVVTGAGRGLGAAITDKFLTEGARVALIDVQREALDDRLNSFYDIRGEVLGLRIDVTNVDQVSNGIKQIENMWGRIDILVNAAGITGKTGIKTHEVDPQDFSFVYQVNVNGTFNTIRTCLPIMLKQNYGRIVNIASISGKEGNAGMLAYSSSKAAVIGLTKVIGKEYATTGITCNAVAPAVIQTEMVAALPPEQVKYMTDKIPMGRTGELNEIANLVAFIASKESSFTTAFTFDASGGRAVY